MNPLDVPQDILDFKPGSSSYQKFLDEAARQQREEEKERARLAAIAAKKKRIEDAKLAKIREAEAIEYRKQREIENQAKKLKKEQYEKTVEMLKAERKTYAQAWSMLSFLLSSGMMGLAAQAIRPFYEAAKIGMPWFISIPFHLVYFAAVLFGWWLAYVFIQDEIARHRGNMWDNKNRKKKALFFRMDDFDPKDWPETCGV